MSLDIREMLLGNITKMRYVYRFQGCRVYDRESIAEHTGYVLIYCDLIARYCESVGQAVDYRALMNRASVHDMEEVLTGDFPRPYKYSNAKLKAALEEAAPMAFTQTVAGLFPGPKRLQEGMLQDWMDAKDTTLEGNIVRLADFMSALSFIVQEVQAGNKSMRTHNWTLRDGLAGIDAVAPQILQPLLIQVRAIVTEYMP